MSLRAFYEWVTTRAADWVLATPPTATSSLLIFNVPVSHVVLWANLLYIVILIVWKLYKIGKEIHGRK